MTRQKQEAQTTRPREDPLKHPSANKNSQSMGPFQRRTTHPHPQGASRLGIYFVSFHRFRLLVALECVWCWHRNSRTVQWLSGCSWAFCAHISQRRFLLFLKLGTHLNPSENTPAQHQCETSPASTVSEICRPHRLQPGMGPGRPRWGHRW